MNSQKICIGAALLAALQLATNVAAAAEPAQRAVQSSTFSLGLVASDSDTKDSTSNGTFGLGGIYTRPIGDLFGVSLQGNLSRTTARTSDVLFDVASENSSRQTCRFNNNDVALGFFARKPTLGKVSASYGKGNVKSDCGDQSVFISTGTDKMDIDYYRVGAEAYLGNFTVGGVHTSTEPEDGEKLESDVLNASWYPLENVKVTLSGGDLYDQDTYGIEIEHQPEFMGNSLGVALGYSVIDRDQEIGTISFNVVYHFGPNVELKVRDRAYR